MTLAEPRADPWDEWTDAKTIDNAAGELRKLLRAALRLGPDANPVPAAGNGSYRPAVT